MIQLLMMSLLTIFSLIFSKMNHPLAMGLMLLIQTMIICMTTGMMFKSFWFSYILFLIFLGGMLVLFIYTTSLASNEMFSLSMKMTIMTISFMILSSIMILFMDKSMIMMFFENLENSQMLKMNIFMSENSYDLNKLYNFPYNYTTIMLMNYLLITLIATVKITNLFMGPLRMSK